MNPPLDDAQVARFHRDGFLVCPQFLDADRLARLHDWVEQIANWPDDSGRCLHYREMTDRGPVLARSERFLDSHPDVRQLLTESPLNAAVSQLFGEPAVVFKEKINYKQSGGGGFAPHQDAVAYEFGSRHITCLLAVDDNSIQNGCLWFAASHHTAGLLPVNEVGCLAAEVAEKLPWQAAPIPAGGLVFFSSFVPHKSPANHSPSSRRSLYVTYNRASEGDLRRAYYEQRDRSIAGHQASHRGGTRISTIGHFQGKGVD